MTAESKLRFVLDYIPEGNYEHALVFGDIDAAFLSSLPANIVHWCRTQEDLGPMIATDGRTRRFVMIDANISEVPRILPSRKFDLIVISGVMSENGRNYHAQIRQTIEKVIAPKAVLINIFQPTPGAYRFPYNVHTHHEFETSGKTHACEIHFSFPGSNAESSITQDKKNKSATAIIVNYNYGQFLEDAIESVLKQTWAVDELIVIDDCSQDRSREVIDKYKSFVTPVINKVNMGVSETRRKALNMASGDVVYFLDSDDRMRSDYVEMTLPCFDKDNNIGVSYTDAIIFGPKSKDKAMSISPSSSSVTEVMHGFYRWSFPDHGDFASEVIKKTNFIHVSSPFLRAAAQKIGGYRHHPDIPEDWYFYFRLLQAGYKAVHVPLPLLEYRQHSGTQDSFGRQLNAQLALLQQRVSQLEKSLASRNPS